MCKLENNNEEEIKVFDFDKFDDLSDEEIVEIILSAVKNSDDNAKYFEESNIINLLVVSLLLSFNWIYFLSIGSFVSIPFMISTWIYFYLLATRLEDYINHYYK